MAEESIPVGHGQTLGVRWQNFRGFADTGWLRLKPLTVLLGANSGGKSSLLAPLLLMKQSLGSQTGHSALLTRGRYINVGAFEDFAHDHDVAASVKFGLRWHSHDKTSASRPIGQYPPGGVELGFAPGSDPDTVKLASYRVEDVYRRTMLFRQLQEDGIYSLRMSKVPPSAKRGKPTTSSIAQKRVTGAARLAARNARPIDFLFLATELRNAAMNAASKDDVLTFPAQVDDARIRFYGAILDNVEYSVRDVTESLYFLGPLRAAPRRVYELSGETPPDVGVNGEYAPEILYRWRGMTERMREVQRWLDHFGFPGKPRFQAVGKEGFALSFGPAKRANSLLDIGFGLSQVLPLIVQGISAQPGSWLVVEQPEVHLNPRLQAALADLLVEIANRNVGLLVETHSEHLLLRLRRLLATDEIEASKVGLHYVERNESFDSIVREVPLDQAGRIEPADWPKGFFDDALRESLALAQAQAGAGARGNEATHK